MNRLLDERGGRVLAIGAHPDDLEIGAGGLLARLALGGAEVTMAVVTIPTDFARRREEARAAAAVIDADLRIVFEHQVCRVEDVAMHELVRRFDQLVGDTRPDLVITHSANDLHWDHGLVHRATVSSLRRVSCDLLAYMSSPELNAQARSHGECFADITRTIEAKLDAIRCHASQLPKLDVESFRDLARATGRISGYSYAECYEAMRIRI